MSLIHSYTREDEIGEGQQVIYTYRRHYILGGGVVSGRGVITGETYVGTDPAYIIKPDDGSPSVHVCKQGVNAAAARPRA